MRHAFIAVLRAAQVYAGARGERTTIVPPLTVEAASQDRTFIQTPAGPSAFHIPSLDGLRTLSFLIVFVAHAGLNKWVPGYFGLAIFFFLSGYLITTLLRREYDRTGTLDLRSFYLRRALRILPPFYIVLCLASVLTLIQVLPGSLALPAVLAQLFHLSNYYIVTHGWWDGRAPGTWIYWSLAVEEHFYLVFPFFYLHLRRLCPEPRHQAAVLQGLCVAALAWRCVLCFGLQAPKDRLYVATDTRVDSILFGCLLAIVANPAMDTECISKQRLKQVWLPLALAALLISFVVREPHFEQTLRYTIQGLALLPIFMVAVRYPHWGLFRLLNFRGIAFLSMLTYSLYLLHTTVLFALGQWLDWPVFLRGAAALTISATLSLLIYYVVERPCAYLRQHSRGRTRAV